MFELGSVVGGRYRVVRVLGSGGMGQVYEAVHEPLARRVALKTLLPEFATDPSLLARFRREAESAAALGHPNIVQVNDFVAEPGAPPFIVMELLEGVTMRQVLDAEGKMAPARAAFIGAQVLSGLAAAHRAGIVHRDVKPANVFLQSTIAMKDIVKVVDFGLAKLVADLTKTMPGVTKNGQVLGTLAYMSPEQASGAPADHRADIWAVGATLFHAVSGLRPFDVIELGRGKTSVATVAPWLDPGLASVIDRALERPPEQRWGSAEEMASALGRFASGPSGGSVAPTALGSSPAVSRVDATVGGASISGSYAPATAPTVLAHLPSQNPPPPPSNPTHLNSQLPPSYPSYPTHLGSQIPPPYAPPPVPMPYPAPPPASGGSTKVIVIGLVAFFALMVVIPMIMGVIGVFRSRQLVANAQAEGEKRFVETAKFPTCPAPDRCTEQHEDHGVTYPVCTNKLPKLNPIRFADYVVVAGAPEKVAFVSTQPSGNDRLGITYVMGASGTAEIGASQVVGRLCRPGRSLNHD